MLKSDLEGGESLPLGCTSLQPTLSSGLQSPARNARLFFANKVRCIFLKSPSMNKDVFPLLSYRVQFGLWWLRLSKPLLPQIPQKCAEFLPLHFVNLPRFSSTGTFPQWWHGYKHSQTLKSEALDSSPQQETDLFRRRCARGCRERRLNGAS